MADNPVQCWVDVEHPATGAKLGHGPLRAVVGWQSTAKLSQAGSFSLTLSGADPQLALIAPKNVVRCWAIVAGAQAEIGAGIIDRVEWNAGGQVVVSGPDLLGELAYRSVHDLELFSETLHTPVRVLLWNGASFDDLTDCYDDHYTLKPDGSPTADSVDLAASNSFLLVGYSAPYNTIYTYQGYSGGYNSVAGKLAYGYSTNPALLIDGAWPEFPAIYDEAITYDIPWDTSTAGANGPTVTLMQRNPVWAAATYDGTSAYWIRFDPDADLDAVNIEEFVIGVRDRLAADVGAIMAYAPSAWSGWDASVGGYIKDRTADGTMAAFAGELVLSALIKLTKSSGESFRLGAGRTLEWLQSDGTAGSFESAGIRATNNTGSARQAANPLTCLIVSLTQTQDTNDLVTRVYPYGAGSGPGRVSLVNATLTMPTGYTLHAADNYIVCDTPDAANRIERVLAFKDVAPFDALTADTEETCNALAQAALTWLQRHSSTQRYYRLEVAGLKELVKVGTTIHVTYRETYDGRVTLNIDEDLIVLGATHSFRAGAVYTTSLDVGTSDAWPATDAEILADMVEQGTIYESHPQPVSARMVKT